MDGNEDADGVEGMESRDASRSGEDGDEILFGMLELLADLTPFQ